MSALTLDTVADTSSDILDFEQQIDAVVKPLSHNSNRFVTFFFGDNLYGINAAVVAEIVQPQPVSPLPNAPTALLGISALRGEITAVIGLRQILGEVAETNTNRSKLVVLRSSDHDTRLAFEVDRLHELVALSDGQMSPSDRPATIISASAELDGRLLKIIDPAVLTSTIG